MTAFPVAGASCHTIISKIPCKLFHGKWYPNLIEGKYKFTLALQCKKVQLSIEKFHWSKKLRKTGIFSFNLHIRVPIESVNSFLHIFLCLNVILTMKHYIKLLTIFIWKFAIFWSWQLALWNLGQLAPA